MTDGEKLDLLLSEIQDIKKDVNSVKHQLMKSTVEIKAMDEMIFDEVEGGHTILMNIRPINQHIRHNNNCCKN